MTGESHEVINLQSKLGSGQNGAVFRAKCVAAGDSAVEECAVKIECSSSEVGGFEAEVRAMTMLSDVEPVVHLRSSGHAIGFAFIVMELVQGCDLYSFLCPDDGPEDRDVLFRPESKIHLLKEVKSGNSKCHECSLWLLGHMMLALRAIHDKGIIHNDLHVDNFLIRTRKDAQQQGDTIVEQVLLADFGRAEQVASADEAGRKEKMRLLNTPTLLFAFGRQYTLKPGFRTFTDFGKQKHVVEAIALASSAKYQLAVRHHQNTSTPYLTLEPVNATGTQ